MLGKHGSNNEIGSHNSEDHQQNHIIKESKKRKSKHIYSDLISLCFDSKGNHHNTLFYQLNLRTKKIQKKGKIQHTSHVREILLLPLYDTKYGETERERQMSAGRRVCGPS